MQHATHDTQRSLGRSVRVGSVLCVCMSVHVSAERITSTGCGADVCCVCVCACWQGHIIASYSYKTV